MSWRLWADARVKQAALVISDAANFGVSPWNKTPDCAPLDRRLQALRKAGHIRYQRKPEGWVLADKD